MLPGGVFCPSAKRKVAMNIAIHNEDDPYEILLFPSVKKSKPRPLTTFIASIRTT